MKTVVIDAGFTGYPAGKKRHFAIGEEPELSNEFADLIIGKGLAHEPAVKETATKPATKPVAAEQKD
jgi:hypothetical protein